MTEQATLGERFEDALAYAARLHRAQRRKGTAIPYVAHLLSVAAIAIEHGADEDTAIAALLHDAVEDQGGAPTREAIRARFGARVAALVDHATDTDVSPKPPWRARKEAYLAHLADAPAEAQLVSAADKLHNARSLLADQRQLGDALWGRFNAGREEIFWYYRAIAATLLASERCPRALAEELDRTVQALTQA